MTFQIIPVLSTSPSFQQVREIRTQVFIIEQACTPAEEWDNLDAPTNAWHWLAISPTHKPMGTVRVLHQYDGYAKLGRLAVLSEYRNAGVATQLVDTAMEEIWRNGNKECKIGAQKYLQKWYEKQFGFERAEGQDEFMEAGILHVAMQVSPEQYQTARKRRQQ